MKFELILRNVKVEYPSLYEARGSKFHCALLLIHIKYVFLEANHRYFLYFLHFLYFLYKNQLYLIQKHNWR